MDKKLEEQLTNGGRVPLPVGANLRKLAEADRIIGGVRAGDPHAIADFKSHLGVRYGETLTTGDDFIFSFAHLTSLAVDTEWEENERNWDDAIETQTVGTFDGAKIYSIDYTNVEGFSRPQTEPDKPDWVPPIVPEGSPYPMFKLGAEQAQAGGIHKAGGIFGISFERIVADAGEIVPQLPRIINEFLRDREDYDAWSGLITFIDNPTNHLQAATTLDGQTVAADAPIGWASIAAALSQARNAEINGRKVRVSSYNILVPVGQKEVAEFYLNNFRLDGAQDGLRSISFPGYNPLSGVRGVVETEYLTGTQWALIPAKGSIRGNKPFYALGRLRGHESPDIRIENVAGNYAGGGAVSPFEGSFETDQARMRGRVISGPLGWNPEYAVISDGDGA